MRKSRSYGEWVLWGALFCLVTVVLHFVRNDIQQVHVVLVFLLLVLGASAGGERVLGFSVALGGFLAINYFFQWPFDTFAVDKSLDLIVLLAFLATASVATHLLAKARTESELARSHANEIERLSVEVRYTEALREAGRLKDVLLASVSHDLRTPLTAIKALAQNVALGAGDIRGQAGSIVDQADRLSRMVADLLDLSRLRAGMFSVAPEFNTAEDLLGATLNQFSGTGDCGRIRTEIDYSSPMLSGVFDFVKSLRILSNLVDNALRYSPSDSTVTIKVGAEGSMLRFRVIDQGSGVALTERERIFEPFYRPSGSKADSGRLGLGLAIARELAVAQQGSVEYSDAKGGGSVFTLDLPISFAGASDQFQPGQNEVNGEFLVKN